MNNTKKAQIDLATKMLKAKIDISEIALMSGLSTSELEELKKTVKPKEAAKDVMDTLDNIDISLDDIFTP